MIGGKVLSSTPHKGLIALRICGTGSEMYDDEVMIAVKIAERMPRVGDAIWWHGSSAMWTPVGEAQMAHRPDEQGKTWDIVLEKVGTSFSPDSLLERVDV